MGRGLLNLPATGKPWDHSKDKPSAPPEVVEDTSYHSAWGQPVSMSYLAILVLTYVLELILFISASTTFFFVSINKLNHSFATAVMSTKSGIKFLRNLSEYVKNEYIKYVKLERQRLGISRSRNQLE